MKFRNGFVSNSSSSSFGDNDGECFGDIGAVAKYQFLGECQINEYFKKDKFKIFRLNEH